MKNLLFVPFIIAASILLIGGCMGEPTLHPVTGTVTLGGKGYDRLLVYFRPIDRPVTRFNMGVGATDKNGVLTFGTGAGDGIAAGNYRVSFSCMQTKNGRSAGPDEKIGDDSGIEPIEIVPPPHDHKTNSESSPLEFLVKAGGENNLVFDIPTK